MTGSDATLESATFRAAEAPGARKLSWANEVITGSSAADRGARRSAACDAIFARRAMRLGEPR